MALFRLKGFINPKNVIESLSPIYLLTYCTGITPFISRSQSTLTTVIGYTLSAIHLSAYLICFGLSVSHHQTIVGIFFQLNITRISDVLQIISSMAIICIIFIFSVIKNYTHNIFAEIEIIDIELKEMGLEINYKMILKRSYFIAVTTTVISILYFFGSYYLLKLSGVTPSLKTFTTYYLPYISILEVEMKFISTMDLIYIRISLMNKILNAYWSRLTTRAYPIQIEQSGDISKSFNSVKHPYTLEDQFFDHLYDPIKIVMQVHNLLCDVSEVLESNLGVQMVAILSVAFIYIVFDGYFILQTIIYYTVPKKLTLSRSVLLFFIIQFSFYIIAIVGITETSHSTLVANQKSLNYVHKILSHIDNITERESLVALSLQLRHREVRFSAAGLFHLDRTLYFTITGAMTTYLIILLQNSAYDPSIKGESSILET